MKPNKTFKICPDDLLAISIGLVYIWFGVLKFFPGLSPADELATKTINSLTLGLISQEVSIILLAIWETVVGLLLVFNLFRSKAIQAALVHMVCTFTPLFLFPELSFHHSPFGFSLVGQYIFKNIVIVSALVVLYKLIAIPNRCNLC